MILAASLGACGGDPEGVATVRGANADGMHGAVINQPYVVPSAPLRDTDGAAYSLTGDTGRPLTLVFFGYTHCPDTCQLVMANITSALTRLEEDQRELVDVVFVTTDPARDDEAALRTYLDRYDPSFVGLTGDLATIVTMGEAVGVYIAKGEELPTGGYEVDHGTPIIAINAADRAPIVWTEGISAANLAEDIITLLTKESE